MKRCVIVVLTLILLCCNESAYAAGNFAVSEKISTLGLGAQVVARVTSGANGGSNLYRFEHDPNEAERSAGQGVETPSGSRSLLYDWHPFKGGFRISGGLVFNSHQLHMTEGIGELSDYPFDATAHASAPSGTMKARVDFNDIVPYAGVGWGSTFGEENRWGVVLGIGVVFQGSPEVDLTAGEMPGASDPTFQEKLAQEKRQIEDALEDLVYYPVIALGITYQF